LHGSPYCYARTIAKRFEGFDPRCGGEVITDRKTSSIWETTHDNLIHIFDEQPMRRARSGKWQKAQYPYGFAPTFHYYDIDIPQRWKKPRTIFVVSMGDLFGTWVPDEWMDDWADKQGFCGWDLEEIEMQY
jgi:protein gp37